MTTKEEMIQVLQELPDDASIEDAMEHLLFLSKIERGLQQADAAKTISHAQVKKIMAKNALTRKTLNKSDKGQDIESFDSLDEMFESWEK